MKQVFVKIIFGLILFFCVFARKKAVRLKEKVNEED
jgi:hypothetical protein